MVYTERADKHVSPSKNTGAIAKVPQKTQQSSGSSGAWSSTAANADKWKFNNMVKDNRDKFNSLHFC